MRDALHFASGLAALIWWIPSLLLAAATALAFICSVDIKLRRVRRLIAAGRHEEAIRVYAAVQRDLGPKLGRPGP